MELSARAGSSWRYRPVRIAACVAVLVLGVPRFAAHAGQTASQSQPGMNHPNPGDASNGVAPLNLPNGSKLEHMREDERRKRLLSDTTRLVELSNDLRSEVEKSSKDELSLDVVRKAAELEKLARDVKERMKN